MEQIEIKNLHFTYPLGNVEALRGINLSVQEGEYIVLCGESGCGKTTLLRHLKASLTPQGKCLGSVLYRGTPITDMDARTAAGEIGFVQQDPESAIVTDKVFHELAFGLENLGTDAETMRLRVAETASYFGMEPWFTQDTATLSGGQMQLLNLASVLAMHPKVLLLDEPTAQLDPIAARDFLTAVDRIRRETGITVILTEHRLEEVLPCADRVVVLHEGRIVQNGTPREIGENLSDSLSFLRRSMPAAMQIYAGVQNALPCPLTVCEGKQWLSVLLADRPLKTKAVKRPKKALPSEIAVRLHEVFYAYNKDGRDVLRGLSLEVPKGSLFALLGGNGAGKSTAMKVAAGILRPYRGKAELFGKDIRRIKDAELFGGTVGVLPQNVCTLFTEKTVRAELEYVCADNTEKVIKLLHLEQLLDRHPYDLSGGEQQRAALGKVLLTDPQILFLDEPTKGMDSAFKAELAVLLHTLCADGKTVFMVSHDVEFCAAYADCCAMLFDGRPAHFGAADAFFAGNLFYTTAANRMARHVFPDAVTNEDVIELCKENLL